MDRREFVGFVGGVLGSVGMPSAPIPAAESPLEKLRRLVESSGGSVFTDSAWDVIRQGHMTLLEVFLVGKHYCVTGSIPRESFLYGVPCGVIGSSLDDSACMVLDYLASRGLI